MDHEGKIVEKKTLVRRERLILDFGDACLLYEFVKETNIAHMIENVFGGHAESVGRLRQVLIAACIIGLFSSCQATGDKPAKPEESAKIKAAHDEKATVEGAKAPAPPADTITKQEVQAVDPKGKEPMDDAITCLARTIYWEARSSSKADMEAIACVVMNRLGHEGFPGTICGIVKEGSVKHACQFSWWCDGLPDSAQNEDAYAVAKEVARKALNRQLKDTTRGAMYFHTKGSRPIWAKKYIRTVVIGRHVFYKPRGDKAK